MKLAIVTGCPNGMVTSVLCARLLDAAAQRQGWSTSVEVHDPKHPERQLSAATIDEAEWVLLVSTGTLDLSRFVGKRLFQSTPSQALQDVETADRQLRLARRNLLPDLGQVGVVQACEDSHSKQFRRCLACFVCSFIQCPVRRLHHLAPACGMQVEVIDAKRGEGLERGCDRIRDIVIFEIEE